MSSPTDIHSPRHYHSTEDSTLGTLHVGVYGLWFRWGGYGKSDIPDLVLLVFATAHFTRGTGQRIPVYMEGEGQRL
jgi:hypothetical protein